MTNEDNKDAFGYGPPEIAQPIERAHAVEAKDAETLEPVVILYVGAAGSDENFAYGMHPDLADALAGQLIHFAKRAREKHWE
jgi:hypothetical protein